MTDRMTTGELAAELLESLLFESGLGAQEDFYGGDRRKAIELILKAGFRLPARIIATVAELDELPIDSVVRSVTEPVVDGEVFERDNFPPGPSSWCVMGDGYNVPGDKVPLPAVLLWEGIEVTDSAQAQDAIL